MGRSQRHKLYVQGVDSSGAIATQPAGGPTDVTLSTPTHASNLAIDQTVGSFTPTGGTGPYTYALNTNPYNTYKIVVAALKTAVAGPHVVGARTINVRTTDAQGRYLDKNVTVTVT